MNEFFTFDQYRVRPVLEQDRAYIDSLIRHDPYHADSMDADWFLQPAPGEAAWAIEDAKGKVVLYFKTQTAVRLSLQFGEQPHSINRDALTKGLKWMEGMLIQNRFSEIIFDTLGPALKALAKKRLGFTEANPGTLIKSLSTLPPGERSTGHWHHEPTTSEEARK